MLNCAIRSGGGISTSGRQPRCGSLTLLFIPSRTHNLDALACFLRALVYPRLRYVNVTALLNLKRREMNRHLEDQTDRIALTRGNW